MLEKCPKIGVRSYLNDNLERSDNERKQSFFEFVFEYRNLLKPRKALIFRGFSYAWNSENFLKKWWILKRSTLKKYIEILQTKNAYDIIAIGKRDYKSMRTKE